MQTDIQTLTRSPADYDYIFVKKVETNVKGLEGEYVFDNPVAVLAGKNGTGKTALMNAITLAVFGEIFEAGARESAKSWALLAHLLPEGQPLLYSKVTFSNGKDCSWVGGPGQTPVHIPPPFPVAAPFEAAMAALRGSTDTMLEYLLTHFGENSVDFGSPRGLGEDPFIPQFPDAPWNIRVVLARKLAAEKARKWAAEARLLAGMVDRLGDRGSSALLQELRVEQERAEKRRRLCKDWEDGYGKSMRAWFGKVRRGIEQRISQKLGQNVHFVWDRTKLYLLMGNRLFTSGAETITLAAGMITAAPMAAKYNLVMLPDRLVDDETARGILFLFADMGHINVFMPRIEHLYEDGGVDLLEFYDLETRGVEVDLG